jgi:hypothetical protein
MCEGITTGTGCDKCCFRPTIDAICVDGVWVVNSTEVIGRNVSIVGGETLVVNGDLILNGSSVIIVQSGHLQIKGDLISGPTGTIVINQQSGMYSTSTHRFE